MRTELTTIFELRYLLTRNIRMRRLVLYQTPWLIKHSHPVYLLKTSLSRLSVLCNHKRPHMVRMTKVQILLLMGFQTICPFELELRDSTTTNKLKTIIRFIDVSASIIYWVESQHELKKR